MDLWDMFLWPFLYALAFIFGGALLGYLAEEVQS